MLSYQQRGSNIVTGKRDLLIESLAQPKSNQPIKLSRYNKTRSDDFGYEIAYQTKMYHLVRNRNLYGNEDSIQLMPNTSQIPKKLPSVKMNLQTNRSPNMVNLHDSRLKEFNKDPQVLSSTKRVAQIDFNKQNNRVRCDFLVDNRKSDLSPQRYIIKEDIVKPRVDFGSIDMDKQFDWNKLKQKGDRLGH